MLYERIKTLCKERGITISGLERELGFAKGSISKIDRHKPSMEKMQKIADLLGTTVQDVTGENEYYDDDSSKAITDFLSKNPDYRVLFDAAMKVKHDDIGFVKEMIERCTTGHDG